MNEMGCCCFTVFPVTYMRHGNSSLNHTSSCSRNWLQQMSLLQPANIASRNYRHVGKNYWLHNFELKLPSKVLHKIMYILCRTFDFMQDFMSFEHFLSEYGDCKFWQPEVCAKTDVNVPSRLDHEKCGMTLTWNGDYFLIGRAKDERFGIQKRGWYECTHSHTRVLAESASPNRKVRNSRVR